MDSLAGSHAEATGPFPAPAGWAPEVLALVGASGTGKSYQASQVAFESDADVIIDDGLLVHEAKILAGRSAKAEPTRVGAIKRAIFADADHACEARQALARQAPARILVLGTSYDMIGRILGALELPAPSRVIRIEDVATPREIWRAKRVRREQGKHVIPAPTLEVRKTFQGYLVDPLRFFLRPKGGRPPGPVVERSVVRPTWSSLGRFYINDTVVMSITLRAAREVAGVARPLRARIESEDGGAVIHLELALWIGADVLEVCRAAQLHVRKVVEYTTGLGLQAVNVTARTMMLPDAASQGAAGGPGGAKGHG
jgi:uncharacterized alkaline shock family protein YloU